MDQWVHFDPETGDFAPPGVDPETGRFPPRSGAVALAAGVITAVALYVALTLWGDRFHGVVIAFPFFAGVVVGALSLRRPLRNAAWTLVAGFALWAFALGGYALYLIFLWPLPLTGMLIGALCGHTLRRFARARRHRFAAV